MAALKVYFFAPHHVYDVRAQNILAESRSRTNYRAYVAAFSKADAAKFSKAAHCGTPTASELRLAAGYEYDAMREAMLFTTEGTVLVTSDRGGKKPIVLMDEELGAQAIGTVRPADGRAGQVFEATMAQYAGRGSIAVGAEVAYVKKDVGYPEGVCWVGTDGECLTDNDVQLRIDLGRLEIIRSGLGDWFTAGR